MKQSELDCYPRKQSSSFVDACRAGGRKYQGPRGRLGRDPTYKSHREWWRQKLFAVLLIIEITCAGKQLLSSSLA